MSVSRCIDRKILLKKLEVLLNDIEFDVDVVNAITQLRELITEIKEGKEEE